MPGQAWAYLFAGGLGGAIYGATTLWSTRGWRATPAEAGRETPVLLGLRRNMRLDRYVAWPTFVLGLIAVAVGGLGWLVTR